MLKETKPQSVPEEVLSEFNNSSRKDLSKALYNILASLINWQVDQCNEIYDWNLKKINPV